jgi:hypothetical protein
MRLTDSMLEVRRGEVRRPAIRRREVRGCEGKRQRGAGPCSSQLRAGGPPAGYFRRIH